MGYGASFQLFPVLVGVPGRAGIAPLRVTRPKDDPQPSSPPRSRLGTKATHLHHGGVGPAVVHHPVVPRVMVAGEQQKGLVLATCRPGQLCDEDRRRPPSRVDLSVQRGGELIVRGEPPPERLAIRLRNGDDN